MGKRMSGSTKQVSDAEMMTVSADSHGGIVAVARIFALSMTVLAFVYLANNVLNFWFDWPGVPIIFGMFGWFGLSAPESGIPNLAWVQLITYLGAFAAVVFIVLGTKQRTLHADAEMLSGVTGYIVRAAFWAVLLIGITDAFISFLRVEGFMATVFTEDFADKLGRPTFRGHYVHYPLIIAGLVIASFKRSLGFHWLAVLIVAAELAIVLARFVFSYEQAFMADLVRFWYGALFLFASPYTLIKEGHVRVDILYAGFRPPAKARTNIIGCMFLGLPLCWVILTLGMWGSASTINGPLLTFEVTQSGFGLYIKYLLAGFLMIFAISMLVQFMSYMLSNMATLLHEPGHKQDLEEHAAI